MQKSALLGDLNKNEAESIVLVCEELIEELDSVFVFPMRDDCFKKIKLIAEGFEELLNTRGVCLHSIGETAEEQRFGESPVGRSTNCVVRNNWLMFKPFRKGAIQKSHL